MFFAVYFLDIKLLLVDERLSASPAYCDFAGYIGDINLLPVGIPFPADPGYYDLMVYFWVVNLLSDEYLRRSSTDRYT